MKIKTLSLEERCDNLEKNILLARKDLADMREELKLIRRGFYRREKQVKQN